MNCLGYYLRCASGLLTKHRFMSWLNIESPTVYSRATGGRKEEYLSIDEIEFSFDAQGKATLYHVYGSIVANEDEHFEEHYTPDDVPVEVSSLVNCLISTAARANLFRIKE